MTEQDGQHRLNRRAFEKTTSEGLILKHGATEN